MRSRFERFSLKPRQVEKLGEEVVYLVRGRGTDFWKIGRTSNVMQRLVSLEENAPFKVDVCLLIGSDASSHRVEEAMLDAVSAWRCHREWHDVHEVEHPAFFRCIDVTLRFSEKCRVHYVEGPAYEAMDRGLKVAEDLGRDTYRLKREHSQRFARSFGPGDDYAPEDRIDYGKWHVCHRRGLSFWMEF